MNLDYRAIPTDSKAVTIYLEMRDAVTPFQAKTGFAYNSAGIVMSYSKKRGDRVAITPVDLASPSAPWTSGGVKEVDAANAQGLVRFDLPAALFAADGVNDLVVFFVKADGYEPVTVRIPLVAPAKKDTNLLGVTVRTNN